MPYKDPIVKKAYHKAYYESHKEEELALYKENYSKNKESIKARVRQRRVDNKELVMQQERVKNYKKYWPGKTAKEALAQYNQLFIEQNGACAICKIHQVELSRALCVDHCHSTGQVRGLLCHHCNLGVGNFKDSEDNLIRAQKYLRPEEN